MVDESMFNAAGPISKNRLERDGSVDLPATRQTHKR